MNQKVEAYLQAQAAAEAIEDDAQAVKALKFVAKLWHDMSFRQQETALALMKEEARKQPLEEFKRRTEAMERRARLLQREKS